MKYRLLRALEYPTNPSVIRRLTRGERVGMDQRGHKREEAGAVVSDLPAASIPWLLDKRWIEAVPDAPAEGGE
jgi:hypothetical protein